MPPSWSSWLRGEVLLLGALLACGQGDGRSATTTSNDSAHPAPPSVSYTEYVDAGGVVPPAAELTNPLAEDSAAAATGEKLFAAMNCDGCHGGGAVGFVGPSLSDGRWRFGGSDGALYQTIFYGRPHGMPAYGGVMSPNSIWQIVSYIRTLKPPANVPTQRW